MRFVDSKGKPTRGSTTRLSGLLPNDPHPPGRFPVPTNRKREGTTSALNAPEREDPWEPTAWVVYYQPDDDGRIVFYAPQGLKHAGVALLPEEEATAFKHRIDPNGPILPMPPPAQLGVVAGDRQLTIIAYRAPTVLVSVKTEDGAVPEELSVMARYTIGAQGHVSQFVRQADGRYRSHSLMPDHEYAIRFQGPREVYELSPIQRISVPESGTAELSFLLRKRRKPPGAGQTAPPFAVTTIEGQALSLASLHGKTVLLHFWRLPQGIPDAATFLAIHERFGNNKRFTMVGLCVSDQSEEATRVIHSQGLSWSQAVLRDAFYDPIAINYDALQPDATFLIGPDGKLIARGLQGTALEKAVAEALAGK